MTYDDIINLPHHVSRTHPHMSIHDRAAQFSPFAALTGYDDSVKETARLTDEKPILDDIEIERIDRILQYLYSIIDEKPRATIQYFISDDYKAGGKIVEVKENIRKIDVNASKLLLENGTEIPFKDIINIF
ncbi:MAG: hypothetical protein IJU93_09940 [Lachnospiraceae bacterium]|nr:hypothetical protein [Lachnospiraceae bacterium]